MEAERLQGGWHDAGKAVACLTQVLPKGEHETCAEIWMTLPFRGQGRKYILSCTTFHMALDSSCVSCELFEAFPHWRRRFFNEYVDALESHAQVFGPVCRHHLSWPGSSSFQLFQRSKVSFKWKGLPETQNKLEERRLPEAQVKTTCWRQHEDVDNLGGGTC